MRKNMAWLTVRDTANFLGISLSATYRLLHRGKISYHRHGRSIRISLFDLCQYYCRSRHPRKE